MTYYNILFLLVCSFTFWEIVKGKVRTRVDIYMYLFLGAILVLFVGFRESGYDYYGYYYIYNKVNMNEQFSDSTFIELGFQYLCSISPNYPFLIFIVSIISVTPTLIFIRKMTLMPIFGVLIFFSTIMFPLYIGQIRQAISVSITLWAIFSYINSKSTIAFCLIIIAAMFHISALLGLLIFISRNYLLSNKQYALSLIISICISSIIDKYSDPLFANFLNFFALSKLTYYQESQDFSLGINSTILFRIITFFTLLHFNGRGDKTKNILLNLYFFSILIYLSLGFIPQLAGRGCLYFSCLECVIIPSMIIKIYHKRTHYYLLSLLFFTISIIRYINFFLFLKTIMILYHTQKDYYNMRKFLFDLVCFPDYGGISSVTYILVNELIKHNFTIDILSHREPNKELQLDKSIRIYQTPNTKNLIAIENYRYVEKLFQERQYDFLIYQDSYAPLEHILCPLSSKYHIRVIICEHNVPTYIYVSYKRYPFFPLKGFLRRLIHPYCIYLAKKRKEYLYNQCYKYILLSLSYISLLRSFVHLQEDSSKVEFINNPIPIKSLHSINLYLKENIILFVGRIVKEKSVDKMIKLWQHIHIQLSDWKFLIIGDGPEKEKCELYVQYNNIKNVTFMGYTDPTPYYMRAKIFWMMSIYEGWPMTLIESMQYACIPIVFDTFSAIYEIVKNNEDGFVIQRKSIVEFAERTIEIATDNSIYFRMAKKATISINKFDISIIIAKWLRILK